MLAGTVTFYDEAMEILKEMDSGKESILYKDKKQT